MIIFLGKCAEMDMTYLFRRHTTCMVNICKAMEILTMPTAPDYILGQKMTILMFFFVLI